MPIIAFRRLKYKSLEASLGYIGSPCLKNKMVVAHPFNPIKRQRQVDLYEFEISLAWNPPSKLC